MKFLATFSKNLCRGALVAITIGACAAPGAMAQEQSHFSFGTPLRYNIVFGYTYSERVKTSIYDDGGMMIDSNERIVTYHISERQVLTDSVAGILDVEANVDSMTVEFQSFRTGERVTFDTQNPADAGNPAKVRHREILAPSVVVNRFVTFSLTPYGQMVSLKKEALDDVREQANTPGIDDFTRARIDEVTTSEYLRSLYFPWRGVLPVGQKVAYDAPVQMPFAGVLGRIPFRDTAISRLKHTDKGLMLAFQGAFNSTPATFTTVDLLEHPLKIQSVNGTIAGDLSLDEDGVVRSGWSGATGVFAGTSDGKRYTGTVSHEIYFKQFDMSPFVAN